MADDLGRSEFHIYSDHYCRSINSSYIWYQSNQFNLPGYKDIGYEDPEVLTPNLDALAADGVILKEAYANSMCTPYVYNI